MKSFCLFSFLCFQVACDRPIEVEPKLVPGEVEPPVGESAEEDAPESTEPPADDEVEPPPSDDASEDVDDEVLDTGDPVADEDEEEGFFPYWPDLTDPFADEVVAFEPGPDAGFGSEEFPNIVLGPPNGGGAGGGSLDVLSLGEEGSIVLAFNDLGLVDGPGADLLVFENPFAGWLETAFVEVSADGETWVGWPCDPENVEEDFPGCAGVASVHATAEFLIDPTDPAQAGGDAFDLADLGMDAARFVRITDSGFNAFAYGGTTGGFDLDAICAANWAPLSSD